MPASVEGSARCRGDRLSMRVNLSGSDGDVGEKRGGVDVVHVTGNYLYAMPARGQQVIDGDAVHVVDLTDVDPLLQRIGIEEPLPGETACQTVGVMHDGDPFHAEQVVRNGDRAQGVDSVGRPPRPPGRSSPWNSPSCRCGQQHFT